MGFRLNRHEQWHGGTKMPVAHIAAALIILLSLLLAVLAGVLAAATDSAAADRNISLRLAYGESPGMDTDNDGVETSTSAIDFTASSTSFSWDVNKTNLCTLWRVLPLQSESVLLACNGATHCCNFAGLVPYGENWNDTFYLYKGLFGVTDAALVSAKAVYVDYKITAEGAY